MPHTEVPPIKLPPPSWPSIGQNSVDNQPQPSYTKIRIQRPQVSDQEPKPHSSSSRTSPVAKKRKDTFHREKQRRAKLENDPWSDKARLTPKSVFCLGCKREIKLDRRNDYYPGLWLKHRGLCQGIARAKARARKETTRSSANVSDTMNPEADPEKMGIEIDSDSSMDSLSDDAEQAARILIELKSSTRRFDDSDSSSSCSDSA
ncbi:hypothetical protein E1B28_011882 [Marasmius oreades]|uniref:Uncharacterized protein n=1 Tax=Marasmius oreades TaxID=181124 RepID=A0A9P7RV23_9AGAR|nr:uncharacterized protein E1B28_011882 [Marasmius oreades]KAG7090284.1 hypothetical protein E1B28_011882 [Marasmius oreades]